jgi:hypothetical protein
MAFRVKTVVDNTYAFLNRRRHAYRLMFNNTEPANIVLRDLVEFSHWGEGPARPTNEETWRLIGRQDVIRRIQQHGSLTDAQLFSLFNGGTLFQPEQQSE